MRLVLFSPACIPQRGTERYVQDFPPHTDNGGGQDAAAALGGRMVAGLAAARARGRVSGRPINAATARHIRQMLVHSTSDHWDIRNPYTRWDFGSRAIDF